MQEALDELIGDKVYGWFIDPYDGKLYIALKKGGPIQVTKKQFKPWAK